MKRLLFAALSVYAPHLLEEHLTRIDDEPWMASALRIFNASSPPHAAYLVFQIMLALALAMTLAFSLGGRPQRAVMGILGFSLLCESHHLLRFVGSHQYNSGLATAFPMPLVGALIVIALFQSKEKEKEKCSTTSSSPWGSGASSSV
jgi:hypothetical protein